MQPGMVIIGAGEAGGCAAVSMREAGWDGAITIVGEERHPPYERPPLSKEHITGDGLQQIRLSAEARRFADLDIAHLANTRVTRIEASKKRLVLQGGTALAYEKLLLATGAQPRSLTVPGGEYALTLRSLEDAWALRHLFGRNRHVILIGAGLIGLELASSAVQLGGTVTIIENGPRPLSRAVPAALAERIKQVHLQRGVRFHFDAEVERVERNAVLLRSGARICCDVIVAAIGAPPNVSLALQAGLEVDNGVVANAFLQTSDPSIFACGDCACTVHPLFSDLPMRLESWQVARNQGALAGRNMCRLVEQQTSVPWFWSDQYDLQLQIAGLPCLGAKLVERDLTPDTVLHFYLDSEGILVGAAAFGQMRALAKDIRVAQMLIARAARPDAAKLAAPAERLKTLLAV